MADTAIYALEAGTILLGYLMGKNGQRKAIKQARKDTRAELEAARPKGAICHGCNHGFSFHKGMGAPCAFMESRYEQRKVIQKDAKGNAITDWDGSVIKFTERVPLGEFPCTCQAYSGPEPLPEVVSY